MTFGQDMLTASIISNPRPTNAINLIGDHTTQCRSSLPLTLGMKLHTILYGSITSSWRFAAFILRSDKEVFTECTQRQEGHSWLGGSCFFGISGGKKRPFETING